MKDQLVTKEELLQALWPETAVTEGVLTTHVGQLRQALGDEAKAPRFIETVHRRGYRFIGKVAGSQHSVASSQHSVVRSAKEARSWRLEAGSSSPQVSSLKSQVSREVKDEAEGCFLKAIEIARGQSAKSWELRATVSLARLWQQQGKRKQAHKMLAKIYGWFTEGFDTADLKEAKTLLEELTQ